MLLKLEIEQIEGMVFPEEKNDQDGTATELERLLGGEEGVTENVTVGTNVFVRATDSERSVAVAHHTRSALKKRGVTVPERASSDELGQAADAHQFCV